MCPKREVHNGGKQLEQIIEKEGDRKRKKSEK